MSEVTELVVIEKQNAMAVFTTKEQLDPIIEAIEKEARSLVPDVSTRKGRDAIASMAHKVARSKTYIDNAGKDLVAELKALPKQIDESRRIVRERLDALKDEVRRPLTEWEAEQERIKAEEAARIKAEEDRKKFESDHEIALLMNDAFDRELAEKKAEAERQRIAHEEELKRQAAEQAKREAEEKAAAELAAAKKREEDAIAAKAQAELLAKQAQERAEREAKEAQERTAKLAQEAREQAEREKQEAIAAEQRKAQEEAARIKREAEQKEAARLAEEKRIADEKAKREADANHRKAIGTQIVNALTANTSISREQAIEVLKAMMDGLVPRTQINY
jgi:DNA polymerase III alpha subunit (gram-positive type)